METIQALKVQLDRIEQNTLLSAKEVLTIDDVAILSGLSKSYLYKLSYTHQIPHYKPNGKQVYFDKSEINAWLLKNRVATDDEVNTIATNYLIKKGGAK